MTADKWVGLKQGDSSRKPAWILILGWACASVSVLAGCATAPPAPPQKVEVPVLVSCVDATKVPLAPVFKFSALTPAATSGDKVLALADDWVAGRAYEGQLGAIIAGCR